MAKVDSRLISIPQYFRDYVDPEVDLETQPTQPCPFHNEKNGKSFSYSKRLGIWRCFGQCHCGGDVIDLHRLNYKLANRDDAKESLYRILGIKLEDEISFVKEEIEVNEQDVHRRRVYALALSLAKQPDDWLDLDYILSKVPYDVTELEVFCASRGCPVRSFSTLPN